MSSHLPEVGEHLITTDGRVVVAVPVGRGALCSQCVFFGSGSETCNSGKYLPGIECWSVTPSKDIEFAEVKDE